MIVDVWRDGGGVVVVAVQAELVTVDSDAETGADSVLTLKRVESIKFEDKPHLSRARPYLTVGGVGGVHAVKGEIVH